jgi:hypothetical protein
VQFADGSSLAINGGLTYSWFFGIGDGAVTIAANDVSNRIVMGAGITASDVYFQSDRAGDLTIGLLGADGTPDGDSIVMNGALSAYQAWNNGWYFQFASKILGIQFADGSSLAVTGSLTDTWWGSAGNTTLVGSGWAANQFESLASGDTLVFGNGSGNGSYGGAASGQNIVDYDVGDGAVTINPNGVGQYGQLDFGSEISDSQLWFSQSGNDLLINILGTQDSVDIQNWFSSSSSDQLSEVVTADGYAVASGLNQLVAAMATFETDNPAFNPEMATQMPNDPAVQAALVATWHSMTA